MKTKWKYLLVSAFAASSLGMWAVVHHINNVPVPTPELADALHMSPSTVELHLYSGDVDPQTGKALDPRGTSYDIIHTDQLGPTESYLTNKDGSVVHVKLTTVDGAVASREVFYARKSGEDFNRLQSALVYQPDGKLLQDEEYRLDGTADYIFTTLPDGTHRVTVYYEDGATLSSTLLLAKDVSIASPRPIATGKVLREEHYSTRDKGAYLLTADVLNADGGRTITTYDAQKMVLKYQTSGPNDTKVGTKTESFYPGTTTTRLKSETTQTDTTAWFYRLDGTVERKEDLTFANLDVEYYQADGKTVTFTQRLNAVYTAGQKDRWIFIKVEQKYPDGSSRELGYSLSKELLETDTRKNFVQDGVKYQLGVFTYRVEGQPGEIGTQSRSVLTPVGQGAAVITQEHTGAENIRPQIPAELVKLPDTSDDLPIPPGVQYFGPWGMFGGH